MDIGGICIFIVFYRYFYSVVREWLYSAFLAFFSVEFSVCFGFSVCVCVCFSDFVSVLVIISLYLPEKIFFRGLSWNVLGKSFFA